MATKKLQILNSLIKEAQNADTLDGKHADEFALASEVEALSTKVGDTAVSDQITAAINAIEPAVTEEEIPNLYVWKKYDSDPKNVKETDVSSAQISWRLENYSTGFSIRNSDSISTDGGSISLVDETTSVITADNTDSILGKYIYSSGSILTGDSDEGYYFIPTTATFTVSTSTLYARNIKKLSMPTCLGYVATKSFAYTSGEQHTDGYWYQYIKQLGDSAVVDGSSVNFTETDPTVPAWAKAATKPVYTASEVGALPDTTVIPSKTSDLTNDSGYITSVPVTSVNGMTGEVIIETETDTVKYIEQTLTDEQREQARRNIARFQYKWHTVQYSIMSNTVADYSIKIGNTASALDCELAINTPSVKLSSSSALGSLAFFANATIASAFTNSNIATNLDATIAEYELIKASGALSGDNLYLCYRNTDDDDTNFALAISMQNVIDGYTHALQVLNGEKYGCSGILYWNNDTKEYLNQIQRKYIDESLSEHGYYADAKATGDALATKVSFTEVQTLTDEQKQQAQDNIGIEIATDDEIISLLTEEDMLPTVTDSDGSILADENDNILLW